MVSQTKISVFGVPIITITKMIMIMIMITIAIVLILGLSGSIVPERLTRELRTATCKLHRGMHRQY